MSIVRFSCVLRESMSSVQLLPCAQHIIVSTITLSVILMCPGLPFGQDLVNNTL